MVSIGSVERVENLNAAMERAMACSHSSTLYLYFDSMMLVSRPRENDSRKIRYTPNTSTSAKTMKLGL